jgi:hypothetical protein
LQKDALAVKRDTEEDWGKGGGDDHNATSLHFRVDT